MNQWAKNLIGKDREKHRKQDESIGNHKQVW